MFQDNWGVDLGKRTIEKPDQEPKTEIDQDDVLTKIESALNELDSEFQTNTNVIGAAEIDKKGTSGIKKQADLRDKIKLWIKERFGSTENFQKTLSEVGEKVANENLAGLESGVGSEIIELKNKITQHNNESQIALTAVMGLKGLDPVKIEKITADLQVEKNKLEQEKKIREQYLTEQVTMHPLPAKQENLKRLFTNYQGINEQILTKRQELDSDISNYETALKNIPDDKKNLAETKIYLNKKLDELKRQRIIIAEREELVKTRINILDQEQKKAQSFTERLNNLGKTKEELQAEKEALQAKNPPGNPKKQITLKRPRKIFSLEELRQKRTGEKPPEVKMGPPEVVAEPRTPDEWINKIIKDYPYITTETGKEAGLDFTKFFQEKTEKKQIIKPREAEKILNDFLKQSGLKLRERKNYLNKTTAERKKSIDKTI